MLQYLYFNLQPLIHKKVCVGPGFISPEVWDTRQMTHWGGRVTRPLQDVLWEGTGAHRGHLYTHVENLNAPYRYSRRRDINSKPGAVMREC